MNSISTRLPKWASCFWGIFITISPVLAILKAGEAGALGAVVSLVHDASGNPINTMYFWMSGLLSAFLDNAPTYLVFFNMAGGDAQALMTGHLFHSLLAISMGSVFMGALTISVMRRTLWLRRLPSSAVSRCRLSLVI